eukprot:1207599-Pleurochrysis_carterae.AAC.1
MPAVVPYQCASIPRCRWRSARPIASCFTRIADSWTEYQTRRKRRARIRTGCRPNSAKKGVRP